MADRVEIRIGPALETLRALPERETFDIAFIDADKASYPAYYEESLARLRPGGLMLVDNVLRRRQRPGSGPRRRAEDEQLAGTLTVNELIRDDERVDVAMVGIADGLTIARKR